MKKTIITIMIVIVSMATFAQKEPGTLTIYPRVGMTLSKFSGSKIAEGFENGTKWYHNSFKPGFTAGAEFQYQLDQVFAISCGALYSQQGEQFKDIPDWGTIKTTHNDIITPVCVLITPKQGFLSFRVGLQPEMKVKGNSYLYRPLTMSIPLGISYEYKNFCLDLRYNHGIINVNKDTSYGKENSNFNRTIMLTLGYGIEL